MNDEIKDILRDLEFASGVFDYTITPNRCTFLKDYITNLQQENERLKEENKHIFANVNDDQLLRSNAMNWAEAQDYKSRIEKAVEYIDRRDIEWGSEQHEYLLNILNGRSDE